LSPIPRPDDGRDGFTLIEAVVALAVLASVLAAISALSASSRAAARATTDRAQLAFVARSLVTELTDRRSLAAGAQSGATSGFVWRSSAELFGANAGDLDNLRWLPYRVSVEVQGPGGSRERIETIRLQRAAP
jgi:general secretion pathway protein I